MNLFFKTKQQIQQKNERQQRDAEHRERFISLMGKIDHIADEVCKRIDLLEARLIINKPKISKKRKYKHSGIFKTKKDMLMQKAILPVKELNGTNEPQ